MKMIKVYVDEHKDGQRTGKRKIVECELIKDSGTTLHVLLPDGNLITRKKKRDLVKSEKEKGEVK